MQSSVAIERRDLLKAGFLTAGTGPWYGTFFQKSANADEKDPWEEATTIGRRELVKRLDGLSQVAEGAHHPFVGGHNAAAVTASAFFCREQKLDEGTQKAILSLVETRLLTSTIYGVAPKGNRRPGAGQGPRGLFRAKGRADPLPRRADRRPVPGRWRSCDRR
jgi:hypothetical protein